MKHVNRVKGRDGVIRLYFRKAGMPSVPLRSAWGSPELDAEVDALLGLAPEKPVANTIRAAAREYELGPRFKSLAESTKYEYRLILKELEDDFGALPLSTFTGSYLLKLQETWAERGHRAAENRLVLLRHVLLPNIVRTSLDPFAALPAVPRSREAGEPHRIWPADVVVRLIERAIAEGKPGIARGVAFGRWAGTRRGDIVKVTRGIRKGGKLAWLSGKRRVPVHIDEDPALTAVLDGTANHPRSMVLAYNAAGRAYTEDGFAQEVGKLLDDLADDGKIDTAAYTLHGLRHTFGVDAALAGCTDAEGAARMGHKSPASFAQYRRQADRIRLSENADAKMTAFRERTSNGELQNDLQNICKTGPKTPAKPRGKAGARSAG